MSATDGVRDFGFRWPRSQARVLEALAATARDRGIAAVHVRLFADAAEATRKGETLHVQAASLDEAREFAAAFPRYGVTEPTIEEWRAPSKLWTPPRAPV